METKKHIHISERTVEILFFLFILVFYAMWARVQPLSAGPDEQMRYQIAQYIYENGKLPVGDDPAVRNAVWGISYAFFPILDYMIAAVFMKAMSLVSTAPFALLFAARCVNVLLGVGTAFVASLIGKRLFERRKAWLFTAFIALMPGSLFVFTYVNCDAMALFASAVIIYSWVRYLSEGWTWCNCLILAFGVSICTLSYYNAYGFILCSIIFFGITLFVQSKQSGSLIEFLKKGSFVSVIVLAMTGWWFIRNGILYDGDFLARNACTLCGEKYAKADYKPSKIVTPRDSGYSLLDMLSKGYPNEDHLSWMELVSEGFVGKFGAIMEVEMPKWLTNNYMDFIKAGFILVFLHPIKTFALRIKKTWNKKALFNWCMLIALIIPNILNVYYSYVSDYQPQGRYSIPMMVPLTYFIVMGYENMVEVQFKDKRLRTALYTIVCALLVILAVYVFVGVIWPEYRDVAFGFKALIFGE